jgi:hypothetical protein
MTSALPKRPRPEAMRRAHVLLRTPSCARPAPVGLRGLVKDVEAGASHLAGALRAARQDANGRTAKPLPTGFASPFRGPWQTFAGDRNAHEIHGTHSRQSSPRTKLSAPSACDEVVACGDGFVGSAGRSLSHPLHVCSGISREIREKREKHALLIFLHFACEIPTGAAPLAFGNRLDLGLPCGKHYRSSLPIAFMLSARRLR